MKTLFLTLFVFAISIVHAQKNKKVSLYLFDENWKSCIIEEAKYLGCFEKLNDTAYQWKYYNFTGPLLSIETYKDKERTIAHGLFSFFGADGKMDSTGYTYNGRKDKEWYYFTDSLTVWQSEEYDNGILKKKKDSIMLRLEREKAKAKIDTVKRVEIEASFKGGDQAWIKYIRKNIDFPDRGRDLKKEGKVLVQFIIGTDGIPIEISLKQSLEYSIDEEAIRLIKKSPKWRLASQDGKLVKAYRLQPLQFSLP